MEIEGLRCSNEDLYIRKQQLHVEVESLEKQMACLTQTNKQLSHELESFVHADMEVQTFLNKRDKVE